MLGPVRVSSQCYKSAAKVAVFDYDPSFSLPSVGHQQQWPPRPGITLKYGVDAAWPPIPRWRGISRETLNNTMKDVENTVG